MGPCYSPPLVHYTCTHVYMYTYTNVRSSCTCVLLKEEEQRRQEREAQLLASHGSQDTPTHGAEVHIHNTVVSLIHGSCMHKEHSSIFEAILCESIGATKLDNFPGSVGMVVGSK